MSPSVFQCDTAAANTKLTLCTMLSLSVDSSVCCRFLVVRRLSLSQLLQTKLSLVLFSQSLDRWLIHCVKPSNSTYIHGDTYVHRNACGLTSRTRQLCEFRSRWIMFMECRYICMTGKREKQKIDAYSGEENPLFKMSNPDVLSSLG